MKISKSERDDTRRTTDRNNVQRADLKIPMVGSGVVGKSRVDDIVGVAFGVVSRSALDKALSVVVTIDIPESIRP